MADKLNRLAPIGNLDTDSDPRYVGRGEGRTGDTTQNRNTQIAGDAGSTSGDITPTLGTLFGFDLGEVSAQNKKYRLTFSGDATKSHQIRLLSTNRDANVANGSGTDGGIPFNGTQADFIAQWNASGTANMLATYPTATTAVIEMLSYDYYQFYIESTGTDDIEVVCTQEAIPVDLAGPLKDIGSYDLLGDLFVFSTTQDNEPTELDVTVTAVGPIVAGVYTGPLTFLTFNQPHGLVAGQWIRITNSEAPWLNGLFVVAQINTATQIGIPTVLAWGGTRPLFTIGSETVRIHPTGIGEIGVAQKDDNTDAWTYTRLLRSVELNFVSKHPVDCHAHKDASGGNFYYNDDYNQPSKFRYDGDYVIDGGLNFILSINEYEYGIIKKQSALVLTSPSIQFNLVSQLQSGGSLFAGNKYYLARTVFSSGDSSNWSSMSRAVNVYSENINSNPGLLSGNNSIQTTKANKLSITGIDPRFTRRIEIAVIEDVDGVLKATIIKSANVGSDEIVFTHSGDEQDAETIDIATVLPSSDSHLPIKAKTSRSIDSINVLTNIETLNKVDLSEWVKTFKHSIKRKYISEATKFQQGEYQMTDNTFNNVGFMLNETYRIGCRAYIKGLGKTDVFWVDDIRVDTNSSNQSNPNGDNRRNSTIPNYDISEQLVAPAYNRLYNGRFNLAGIDTGTPLDPQWQDQMGVYWGLTQSAGWEAYSNGEFYKDSNGAPLNLSSISRLIVPYINIEDIDYSFNIEAFGLPASEMVEALEFFIGDIPRSVKASGIGIMSVETPIGINPSNAQWGGPVDNISQAFSGSTLRYAPWPSGNDRYIMEYPYSTGASVSDQINGNPTVSPMALNYPVQSFPYGDKFIERRDFVSFYSGDTLFNESEDFSGDELIVFGVCDLQNNFRSSKGIYDTKYCMSAAPPITGQGQQIAPKSSSYWAKFSPRLTGSTYASHSINSQEYINPDNLPEVTGLRYETFGGVPTRVLDWTDNLHAPTAEELFASSIGGDNFSKRIPVITRWQLKFSVGNALWSGGVLPTTVDYQKGPVLKLDNPIDLNDPNLSPSFLNNNTVLRYGNRGVVYSQIYTDERSGFPEISDTNYIAIGSMLITPSAVIGVSHELKCGDTYTQTTIIKHRSTGVDKIDLESVSAQTDVSIMNTPPLGLENDKITLIKEMYETGFGSGIIATCQNRVNSNMFTIDENKETDQLYYGKSKTKDWLASYSYEVTPLYNSSYDSLRYLFLSSYYGSGFFGNVKYDFPNRIMYSLRKDQSGVFDEYRVLLPLNIKDLDLTFGEINHHEDLGGELFTVQSRKYQLQYFNARGTLEASSSSVEVLIGDGSVLSRDGQTLSSYGTQHKWSCIKGLNANGKDVLYWFNAENGLVMRFGEDGTRVISARGMAAFFANYTKWVKNKDEHAFEQGIRGVWDDRRKEAIWTFTGWRLVNQPWASGNLVEAGEVVTNTNAPFDTYEEFPRFFRCTGVHQSSPATEPGVGPQWEHRWEAIAYTDKAYYSIFTICFNEMTNGFRCFYGHLPKTYLRWQNTFLSSHPVNRNLIFEHRLGEPTTWYGVDTFLTGTIAPKVEDAYFEMVVNEIPEQSFGGVAVDALTENAPDRVEYRTARQYTFDNAVDFEQRDDQFYSCIKNDATLTNNPDSDGEYLRGDFLKAKVFIFGGTYNLFHSIVVKIRETLRRTNT